MIAGMCVSSALFKVGPLVSIIGAFFTGGVAVIFGNALGGTRGAVISGLVYGFLLIVGSGFLFTIFDYAVYGAAGVGHDCLDVMAVMIAMKYPYIGIAIIVAAFALLCWREAVNKKMK